MKAERVVVYHNPRCSKSRQALALLEQRGVQPTVVEYLKNPPKADEVAALIGLLGIPAHELLRKGEAPYKELGLSKDSTARDVASAIAAHPILLERPVVVVDDRKAVIGRPPERVLELFEPG